MTGNGGFGGVKLRRGREGMVWLVEFGVLISHLHGGERRAGGREVCEVRGECVFMEGEVYTHLA